MVIMNYLLVVFLTVFFFLIMMDRYVHDNLIIIIEDTSISIILLWIK